MIKILKTNKLVKSTAIVYLANNKKQLKEMGLAKDEFNYANTKLKDDVFFVELKSFKSRNYVVLLDKKLEVRIQLEKLRAFGHDIYNAINSDKQENISIVSESGTDEILALAEGISLSSYNFSKYFKDAEKKKSNLKKLYIKSKQVKSKDIDLINATIQGVFYARDISNEPLSFMTAKQLSKEISLIGKNCGFSTEILNKKQIESLKMGGLLAVNRGSFDPPTFNILTWAPKDAINDDPYILVGKGIVFDTGGINLKPTGSLETMKSDKAGAAGVIGTIAAVAKAKLPIKLIALVPATDNRPGNNAYVPQDIVKMYDGTTVEVLNTDAEGRMILADALAYAKQYNPKLVIDMATLTGAAVVAVGTFASALMGNDKENMNKISEAGLKTGEKLVELPLWEEYKEMLKSDFADLKNIGGRWAGAITAGKFLEHFTDYKWMHVDIAGPSYNEAKKSYHGVGGSGVGVRLLMEFFNNYVINNK